jgi:hypothetical protein
MKWQKHGLCYSMLTEKEDTIKVFVHGLPTEANLAWVGLIQQLS